MKTLDLNLGCQLITTDYYQDYRGYFLELYRKSWLKPEGVEAEFVQHNMSFSKKGVVRGLHRQNMPMAQGKYVRCLSGHITDVAVDTETGEIMSVELDTPNKAVWIPGNLNHGFWAREDSLVMYLCTAMYDKDHESGINPLSEELNLPWKNRSPLIVSSKDLLLPEFRLRFKRPQAQTL